MTEHEILKAIESEYLAKILGFCYQKVPYQEAEDLTSDITLEIIKTVKSGKEITNLGAFVWSVSNHTFCKWLRKKKLRDKNTGTAVNMSDLHDSESYIESDMIIKEEHRLIRCELAMLSENYRKTLVMYYINGKSCSEIARLLNNSEGTVK